MWHTFLSCSALDMIDSDMDDVFTDLCEVIHADLGDDMNRTGWPNITPNAGSFHSHNQIYSQQRKIINASSSSYNPSYQNQLQRNITAGYVSEQYGSSTKYVPEALSDEYFQSVRNGQGDMWKETQEVEKLYSFGRKCMCSCSTGAPRCICGFSRQQEQLKPSSLQQNSLQWHGETNSTQHNHIDTTNPHQSFTVPSSTYGYPFMPDYPGNIGSLQKSVARGASLPNNTTSPFGSFDVKPQCLSTRGQTQKDITSPNYESSQIHSSSQFRKSEFPSSPQCKSSQVNRPNSTNKRKRPRLCNFLLELLANPQKYSSIVEWVDEANGVFKFLDSSEVASQWGRLRDKPNMKYENFARSLRTYIAKGIMTKPRSRLVYRFTNVDSS